MLKEIKMAQNVIRAYCNCLESYFGETNVRNPIIEKPNVWSPIIANFSVGWAVIFKYPRVMTLTPKGPMGP